MTKARSISWQTRKNWLIDFAVFSSAWLAILSGIYFLYLPSGGYQGGRNPMYNITVLFTRHTWSDIHTWGGLLMIVAVAIHFAIHWQWVAMMARRMAGVLRRRGTRFSRGAKINLAVNVIIALAFLITAVSGIYLLFVPGGHQAGPLAASDSDFLFTHLTWDLVHTWAGVTMTVAAMLHFAIHWRWVVKVTWRFFQLPEQARRAALQS
jgi:preprotein translocase subunit SecY